MLQESRTIDGVDCCYICRYNQEALTHLWMYGVLVETARFIYGGASGYFEGLHGTGTGRLDSRNPKLANPPREGELT